MSEPRMVEGKKLNNRLLEEMIKRRDALFQKGHIAYNSGEKADVEEIDAANDKRICKSDKEEYDCLHEIETSFLIFGSGENGEQDKCQDDQVYEIPGVKVKIGGEEINTYIYVRKDKISALARKAKDYERILSAEGSLQIKFPNQIYQFNHDQTNVPGTTYLAPEPKLVSQTQEDYENSLEAYYDEKGVKKEETEDKQWRKPYPHEYVDYKGAAVEKKDEVQSEYYLFNSQAKKKDNNKSGKLKFTSQQVSQKDPLIVRIKNGILGAGSAVKNEEPSRKKIKYILATGGAIAVGTYFGLTSGLLPAALPAVGIFVLYKYLKKKFDKMREEKEEREKGKGRKPEGNGGHRDGGTEGGHGGQGDPVNPDSQRPGDPLGQGTGDPIVLGEGLEENLESLRQNAEEVKNIEDRIAQVQREIEDIKNSALSEDEKKAKIAELNTQIEELMKAKRTILEGLKGDIENIFNSYQLGNEEGGPKL